MPDRPVIANNTPLASLWAIRRLPLLQALFGHVVIPQEVADEFLATDTIPRQRELTETPWLEVRSIANPRRILAYGNLDLGEAAVLALAEETDARLLIIDEDKGRRFARRLDFSVIGTLGLFLLGKEQGHLEAVGPEIQKLRNAGFYLGKSLVSKVLTLAGEI